MTSLYFNSAFADSILKTVYGIGAGEDETYVGHGETALAGLAAAGHPGAFLVDIFPIMKIIPKWFPGAGWKRKAAVWRHVGLIVANSLWDTVKKRVVRHFFSFEVYHSTNNTHRRRDQRSRVLLRHCWRTCLTMAAQRAKKKKS
jgi:hypothetical protein